MGVIYQVTSGCDSDPVGIFFLRSEVYHNSCVGDRAVSWNVGNFCRGHDEYAVGAFLARLRIALCDVPEFFSKGGGPRLLCDVVSGELSVVGNRLARDRMDHGRTEVFDVHIVVMCCVLLFL